MLRKKTKSQHWRSGVKCYVSRRIISVWDSDLLRWRWLRASGLIVFSSWNIFTTHPSSWWSNLDEWWNVSRRKDSVVMSQLEDFSEVESEKCWQSSSSIEHCAFYLSVSWPLMKLTLCLSRKADDEPLCHAQLVSEAGERSKNPGASVRSQLPRTAGAAQKQTVRTWNVRVFCFIYKTMQDIYSLILKLSWP